MNEPRNVPTLIGVKVPCTLCPFGFQEMSAGRPHLNLHLSVLKTLWSDLVTRTVSWSLLFKSRGFGREDRTWDL